MVKSIKEIQAAGVEPAIWKLEGVDKPASAKAVVKQAQSGGRKAGRYHSWIAENLKKKFKNGLKSAQKSQESLDLRLEEPFSGIH